ncbi:hypothetical protein G6F55_011756 [Rhizopus delemar]|nr:hypothetical protein G6F55_011756 [Rhizopus delemar]KAG1540419.1 hypothetical protein G6F51_008533 [Rhizopus arrhizus]KAG1494639.1 hypothetical protein G6F54_007733 [Rhizopus delemar]KAG1508698.1 hypothetical protein G6F53_007995 [Rhizopus delemar]KAG1520665.1 hypothetical protein G6F52_007451 [Rhizopus delemar]
MCVGFISRLITPRNLALPPFLQKSTLMSTPPAIICYWYNGSGHIAKYCDRKNLYGAAGVPNKKSRKVPAKSGEVLFTEDIPATVASSAETSTGTAGMTKEVLKPSTEVDTVVLNPQRHFPLPNVLEQRNSSMPVFSVQSPPSRHQLTILAYNSHETLNPPDTSQSSSPINFRIDTLNCQSLVKSADVSTRNHFIRYLRTRPLEILALQETHASTIPFKQTFHMQFQASDSLWSPHCGLVCFSALLSFSNTKYSVCGRVISTKVTHVHGAFDPVTITVVYAPAGRRDRFTFLEKLAQNGASLLPEFGPSRHILLSDFNYIYATHLSSSAPCHAPSSWLSYIDSYFTDCATDADCSPAATFSRGSSCFCIDYFSAQRTCSNVEWPQMTLIYNRLGLIISLLRHILLSGLQYMQQSLVKMPVAHAAKSFSRRSAFTLTKAESLLHRKRSGIVNRLAANASFLPSLTPQLSIVESQLASIQQYHTETLTLRAGIHWREQGALSAGYLKRTAAQRQTHQIMKQLLHPVTSTLCSTPEEMIRASVSFYSSLYSPDPIDDDAVEDLLSTLPSSLCLSASDQRFLINSFTYDALLDGVSRCPKRSSPGLDGLSYEILRLIFIHPSCRDLLLQVYNDAFSKGIFPNSWLGTSVSLLPKKGTSKISRTGGLSH